MLKSYQSFKFVHEKKKNEVKNCQQSKAKCLRNMDRQIELNAIKVHANYLCTCTSVHSTVDLISRNSIIYAEFHYKNYNNHNNEDTHTDCRQQHA